MGGVPRRHDGPEIVARRFLRDCDPGEARALIGGNAAPDLVRGGCRLVGVKDSGLDRAGIKGGRDINRVRIVWAEAAQSNVVCFAGVELGTGLTQIGGSPDSAARVEAAEEESVGRVDGRIATLGVVVDSGCDDALDAAVGISADVIVPTT